MFLVVVYSTVLNQYLLEYVLVKSSALAAEASAVNSLSAIGVLAPPTLSETDQPVVSSNLTEVRLVQPENTSLSMLVTLLGMVIEVKLLHSSNAPFPILVTLGMLIEVKPAQ